METTKHQEKHQNVLAISDKAVAEISKLRSQEPDADQLALFVEITGTKGDAFTYDLYFAPLEEVDSETQTILDRDNLKLVVNNDDTNDLVGAVLDTNRDLLAGGLVIRNPNTPPSPPSPLADLARSLELSGSVEDKVRTVLEQAVNPSIASHGGRAELVRVESDTVFLRLDGGCQGCAMSKVTLTQGIEVAIKAALPEITSVVDETDHLAGQTPFYS